MAETIREKNILFKAVFDDSQLVSGTKRAAAATAQLDKEVEKVGKSSQKSSQETQKSLNQEVSAAAKREKLIREEIQDLAELRKRRSQAYSVKEIKAYNSRIEETKKRIKILKGETDNVASATSQLNGILSKAGIAFSAAYAVDKVKDFLVESVKLANQTRNVRNAFNQLDGATNILNDLRDATAGTVDDLTLMRQAVRANNFKIPLTQLATFFQFASDRAAATGESVDYLVNSIVDGIGRKSTLVLDNLGISAARIQEEIKKTGDFGQAAANIIAEEMAMANVNVDEGARAAQRLNVAFTNLQLTIGEKLAPTANSFISNLSEGIKSATTLLSGASFEQRRFGATIEEATESLRRNLRLLEDAEKRGTPGQSGEATLGGLRERVERNREYVRVLQIVAEAEKASGKGSEELGKAIQSLNGQLEENIKTYQIGDVQVDLLKETLSKLTAEYNKQATASALSVESTEEFRQKLFELNNALELAKFEGNIDQINRLRQSIVALNNNYAALNKDGLNAVKGNLFDLEQRINALVAEQKAETTTIARVKQITDELNALYKEQDELLGRVKKGTEDYKKSMADLADEIADFNQESIDARTNFDAWLKFYEESEQASKDASKANVEFFEGLRNIPDEPSGAAIGEPDFEGTKDVLDKNTELYSAYASTVTGILGSINSYQNALYEAELQSLKNQLDNKVITEQQYELRVSQEKRKRAQADKRLALFEIAIDTASSVAQTAANLGYPAAIPFVALAIAEGAAQAALVSAQPIPQFAKGVIGLEGPGTETSDSIPARLSKGESVMTAKETKQYGDVFEAIRNNTFDQFAQEHYIRPALLNQQISPRQSTVEGYNDYRLIKTVRENRNVGIKNADDIGRSVARHLNHNNWLSRKFR